MTANRENQTEIALKKMSPETNDWIENYLQSENKENVDKVLACVDDDQYRWDEEIEEREPYEQENLINLREALSPEMIKALTVDSFTGKHLYDKFVQVRRSLAKTSNIINRALLRDTFEDEKGGKIFLANFLGSMSLGALVGYGVAHMFPATREMAYAVALAGSCVSYLVHSSLFYRKIETKLFKKYQAETKIKLQVVIDKQTQLIKQLNDTREEISQFFAIKEN